MTQITQEQIFGPLNVAQRAAVAQIEGPLLILAGPGSGKTRVITHRIANIIAHGAPSDSIVALTFTNKAAQEMKNRVRKLAPGSYVWTGTFHKFCARMLRSHAPMVGLTENFTIYDSGDSRKVMKQAIENANVDLRHYSPNTLANEISNVKNNAVSVGRFQGRPGHALDAIIAKVFPEYQKLLREANAVDFDDLLLHAVDLLRDNPELRQSYDQQYQYMMVDEYQDTNLTQYQLIRLLNHSIQNLGVTGDPDQSIYGWRGANLNNILGFERDYPEVNVVRLEQNYRSTKSILAVADQLISNNVRRKEKKLFTENDEGQPTRLVTYPSPKDEAEDMADSIALAWQQGTRRPNDYAILYRTNRLSRTIEHALRAAGVPYQIVNGHEFYQRKEIKDVLGYLHLLNNPKDNVAFERIVNTPPRKIGKVTLNRLRAYAQDNGGCMLDAARDVAQIDSISKAPSTKITQFVEMIDRISEAAHELVEDVIKRILEETGYREWLTLDGSEEGHERAGNVDELQVAASEFDRDHPEDGGLEAYLEQASLVADTDVFDETAEYVTLMTLHAAKGLEFPCVYIVGLEDGMLPHERSSNDDDQLEEERRLLFVGITRAEQELQLSRCQNRFRRGSYWPCIASRFLMELPREQMQIDEPSAFQSGHDDLLNSLDSTSWGDGGSDFEDLPSIDVNAIEGPNDSDDSEFESSSGVEYQPDPVDGSDEESGSSQVNEVAANFAIPQMMTAAQLAERHATLTGEKLEPDEFCLGMEVAHAEYGVGTVTSLTGDGKKRIATIDFSKLGEKRIRLAFSNLRAV